MSNLHIHHVCIQTSNYPESFDFYTQILLFEVVKINKNFHGRNYNTWLKNEDFFIELQTPKNRDNFQKWSAKNEGPVHLSFYTQNFDKELDRIMNINKTFFKIKGDHIVYNVHGTKFFKIIAPEGTEIEIRDTSNL